MTSPDLVPERSGGCPVHRDSAVPLSGPRFHTDPFRLYAEMRREHGPVVAVELPGGIPAWLVIGYRELHQVTSDAELFPRDVARWNQWPNIPPDWPLLPMVGSPMPSIYFTAGAEHRRHVAMVEPALEAVNPFELRATCEELADRLIDSFCGRGEADMVADFAEPLPVLALARIMGFPDSEAPELATIMKHIADSGAEAQAAYGRFNQAMANLVAAKQRHPGSDLVSMMLAHPEPFTAEEYTLDLQAILAAGHLTTADWLVNSLRLMLTDDRFAAAFGGGRSSVGQAMNEALWEDTPTQILAGRWAARDTRLADKTVRSGDLLLLGLGAANTDPHVRQGISDGPESAYLGNSAHFAFSYGEYRCPYPAQQIAEVIARTGIEVLLDRLPDVDLAVPPQNLMRRPSPFLRGMTSLPVVFTPVRAVGGFS
ncbi:cytochrome P450 [Nocardia otitidiscaviarum]|uniref:Cytochrome P450 n=1 Tax=Nocardia otitidiscaviarum TaxID=1823 RepID=A0A378YRP7_9NOCA|nr:cytochrome P450 [Nocardia otitidiscaviarum]MBF6138242.1 cytochrome P450 [Nocardia otitidiscaviarum]MBF6181435.1 cytochrome P450 [Nocardia otitidiscaviarum]MBF6489141.1 cytochrome P450 [Nocardia otitidiscaviarum]MCP9624165.1 cytochrome P450 [Nocardia otitidiscaviarum]QDP80601.1 cytochrome P450 [Nocardia otitidiscaviarum]